MLSAHRTFDVRCAESIQMSKAPEEDKLTKQCLKKGLILHGERKEEERKKAKTEICINMSL